VTDLVRQILSAIEKAERLAHATIATVNPAKGRWVVAGECGTEVRDSRGHLIVKHSWPNEIAHIIHNDPVSVLRRCAADRRRLERHRPGLNALGNRQVCGYDRYPPDADTDWPCPDVLDLADSYGITQKEQT
jgi:hypothetical protein